MLESRLAIIMDSCWQRLSSLSRRSRIITKGLQRAPVQHPTCWSRHPSSVFRCQTRSPRCPKQPHRFRQLHAHGGAYRKNRVRPCRKDCYIPDRHVHGRACCPVSELSSLKGELVGGGRVEGEEASSKQRRFKICLPLGVLAGMRLAGVDPCTAHSSRATAGVWTTVAARATIILRQLPSPRHAVAV